MRAASWISWLLLAGVALAAPDPAQRTLVIYNRDEPESEPLARYYAEKRAIPVERLVALRCRNAETITRQEFESEIRQPLHQWILDRQLCLQLPTAVSNQFETIDNKIDTLVLVYGMPLRVQADPTIRESLPATMPDTLRRNEASVDSELTIALAGAVPRTAFLPNPFFGARSPTFGAPHNLRMQLVARLDGPSPAVVRRMIDDAVATEKYGLLGRCYFDARSVTEAGYVIGDKWIQDAAQQFRTAGFETELDLDPAVYSTNAPLSDVAVYAGWYEGNVTGPFARSDFRFRRGAVAYHLHSGSAVSIRTQTANWVGPLLARGAAVSFGNCFEPYLQFTPHLDKFFERLLAGASYGEAGWWSQPVVSWQTTFCGDPLYRPFTMPVDEQITRLELANHPDREWAYLRKANLSATNDAIALCRTKAPALKSSVLYEKLGDLLPDAKDRAAAYATAWPLAGDSNRVRRIMLKLDKLKSDPQKDSPQR